MINKVIETVSKQKLLEVGDSVIVALSGGADSVSLLHVLLRLREELKLKLYAAHLNHNIRGEEALRDENFVRELCKRMGVELYVKSLDIPKLSVMRGESEELCGRNMRYEFFSELSSRLSAKIATAHTLSDCEETMLYNISRGTSLHGLCSIPYKRDNIVRPLLNISREEIEEYIKEQGLSFVEDSTNFFEDVCKRNKIRLSVLKPLKALNSGFHENFSRLRAGLSEVDDYMSELSDAALGNAECEHGYDAAKLLSNHSAVLSYTLSKLLYMWGVSPQQKLIELMKEILRNGGAVSLCKGKTAVCKQGILRLCEDCNEHFSAKQFNLLMEFTYLGKKYSIKEISLQNHPQIPLKFLVSCDSISSDTVIRTRLSGDTFAPVGRNINKDFRKLQNEAKIPAEKRDTSLVIADKSRILWSEYLGASEFGKIKNSDKTAILIEVTYD